MSEIGNQLCHDMIFKGYKPTKEEHELIIKEVQDEFYVVDPTDIESELEEKQYDKDGVLIAWHGRTSYKRDVPNDHERDVFGNTTNYYRKKTIKKKSKTIYPVTNQVWVKPSKFK